MNIHNNEAGRKVRPCVSLRCGASFGVTASLPQESVWDGNPLQAANTHALDSAVPAWCVFYRLPIFPLVQKPDLVNWYP